MHIECFKQMRSGVFMKLKVFNKASSSLHVINSDYSMTPISKLGFMALNFLNNLFNFPKRRSYYSEYFFSKYENVKNATNQKTSPARFLSNTFWAAIDFDLVRKIVGGSINVLDVGCGSGEYRKVFKLKPEDNYLGIDISTSPYWEEAVSENVNFKETSYENVAANLSGRNVLITQSALEHFNFDLKFFQNIHDTVAITGQPLIQIHIFPARSTLLTYLWHGIRQYNLRGIGRIVKISQPQNPAILVSLGGKHTSAFHWKSITIHQIMHRSERFFTTKGDYLDEMLTSLAKDANEVNSNNAVFYALIMQHNLDQELEYTTLVMN